MGKPNMGFLSSMLKKETAETEKAGTSGIQQISVHLLVPHEENFYDMSDIEKLEDAIEVRHGVRENLIVTPIKGGKYKIISGHRRRQAVLNLLERGVDIAETVPCQVEIFESKAEEKLAIILSNLATRELSEWEKIEQYKRLKGPLEEYCKDHKVPGRMRDFVAKATGLSSSKIGKMENISNNLSPEFQEELRENKINFSTAAELAGLPKDAQAEMHEEHKRKGATSIKDVKQKKAEVRQGANPDEKEAEEYVKGKLLIELEFCEGKEKEETDPAEKKKYAERVKYLKKVMRAIKGL